MFHKCRNWVIIVQLNWFSFHCVLEVAQSEIYSCRISSLNKIHAHKLKPSTEKLETYIFRTTRQVLSFSTKHDMITVHFSWVRTKLWLGSHRLSIIWYCPIFQNRPRPEVWDLRVQTYLHTYYIHSTSSKLLYY